MKGVKLTVMASDSESTRSQLSALFRGALSTAAGSEVPSVLLLESLMMSSGYIMKRQSGHVRTTTSDRNQQFRATLHLVS